MNAGCWPDAGQWFQVTGALALLAGISRQQFDLLISGYFYTFFCLGNLAVIFSELDLKFKHIFPLEFFSKLGSDRHLFDNAFIEKAQVNLQIRLPMFGLNQGNCLSALGTVGTAAIMSRCMSNDFTVWDSADLDDRHDNLVKLV